MLAISSSSGQFRDWTMWPEFPHLNNNNDNSIVGRMNNIASPAPDVLRVLGIAPPFPQTIPPRQESTGHRLPPSLPESFLTAPGTAPCQLHSCPFGDAVCFPCLKFYHFLQENICLPITLIMPPGAGGGGRGRLWGEISSGFCLLCWENKQACLTYLCFPSRWTPRSKHGIDLSPAPWTFRAFKPRGFPFSTACGPGCSLWFTSKHVFF